MTAIIKEMTAIINKILQKPYIPLVFRIATLVTFIGLMYGGFAVYTTDKLLLKELRNTNLPNLLVWSYWWPLIVMGAIFFGRVWCFVCPVELVTSLAARVGLKKERPAWLTSGWAITVFYLVILSYAMHGLKIHHNPYLMALYLVSIFSVSILTGLIFKKNTFCRYVCPVGYVLGLYSRLSMFGWRVKAPEVCRACKDKSCVKNEYGDNIVYKSCGVDLYPAGVDDNMDCILCTGCLKSCMRYNSGGNAADRPNPGLEYIGFFSDPHRHKPLTYAQIAFVFIASGFVMDELISFYPPTNAIASALPAALNAAAGLQGVMAKRFLDGFVKFVCYPAALWSLPFLALRAARSKIKLLDYARHYGVAFIPIMAAMHMSRALVKLTDRFAYFKAIVHDPLGMKTAALMISKELVLPPMSGWTIWAVTGIISAAVTGGVWLSAKIVKDLNSKVLDGEPAAPAMYMIPAVYGGIFIVTLLFWRWVGFQSLGRTGP